PVPEQVVCVAGDPRGYRGGHRDHFDLYRHWDGMDAFEQGFAALRDRLLANGADVSVLHGGIARFGALLRDAREREAGAHDSAEQLGRLRGDTADRLREGLAIRRARAERLVVLVGEFLDRELDKALRSTVPAERKALAERLERWTRNEELHGIAGQWWTESEETIEAWRKGTARVLRRRLDSRGFDRTFPDAGTAVSLGFLSGHTGRKRRRRTAKGLGRVGAVIGKADAQAIARIGTWLNRTVDPATLARGASALGRLGIGLQAVSSVVDVYTVIRNARDDRELAQARRAAIGALHEEAAQWAERIADGTEEDPGPLRPLDADCEELAAAVAAIDRRVAEHDTRAGALRDRSTAYRHVITDALARLGHRPGGDLPHQPTEGTS
ncbi:hypothetical protein, partial [Kitasatospora putterlickiae]|uniref:hypothetical protein n=1 Tax=Kitasatospora putterlickiae TaxID=221725 RepID=UPI0031D7C432